jgi:hypothetical protein
MKKNAFSGPCEVRLMPHGDRRGGSGEASVPSSRQKSLGAAE